ncbi:cadherin-1 isoform X4 [Ctenopharyngodon idella]|uniref:cadherin-1 isoform X4 n=1 Tax=Ctenopharyngodon idella TaxID=7959 RepID=UPI00222F05B7|nr:cadherin-1 isoform X4 [Ctenopharyngodon idella]
METMKFVQLGFIIFLCKAFVCGFAEESSCTPGFESELLVFKVHRDHLHQGKRLGRVIFNTCDGRTRMLFQSSDKWFDVDTDGTVTLKRQVTLHEGHKVFSVHAWDSSGKKHTVSVRVERVHHHEDHHMDTVMNISSPQSSTGLKRAKRGWVIPPFRVLENSRGPFPIKLVQIKSEKSSEAQMQYSITGEGADLDPKGTFIIETFSGNLFVTRPLDRERKASYRIIAHATGVDVNIEDKPMEIIVHVLDQNDNYPVFTQNPFNGNVPEAAEIGHEFMTVTATDADDPNTDNGVISYSIVKQDPELPKPNMFEINSVTGGIRVNSVGLDKEKWSKYTLTVVATDMEGRGYSTTGTAVITVTDSNDNAPQFEQTSQTVSVPENKVGAVVAKLAVTDEDEEGSPAWSTKYRIISGDKGGFFNVSTGPSRLEGIITTAKPLDFEKNKQYILSVIVENDEPFVGALATSTATVTVNVEDVNEPPEFNPKEKIIYKPEDSPIDTELVSYTATDPDIGKSQKIMYKIGNDPEGWLSVNQDTGLIKVRKLMDRESSSVKDDKYRAIILAVDDGDAPATGTGTLIIELSDVNDNAPVINERIIKICNRGSTPVLLSITDKDGPPYAGPFTVETQGETSENWSATMNETSTGVFLKPKFTLEQGDYNVILRVFDNHRLSQDSTIQASVCDCEGDDVQCTDCEKASCSASNAAINIANIAHIVFVFYFIIL